MQVIYKNKNKEYISREAGTVNIVLCIKKIGRYLEREHNGEFKKQQFGICNNRRISHQLKTRVQRKDNKTIKKFVQEFRKVARKSEYKGKPLIKKLT